MTAFAPLLQGFFTDRLVTQRHASTNTIAAYRDTLKLLLIYNQQDTGKAPANLGNPLESWRHDFLGSFPRQRPRVVAPGAGVRAGRRPPGGLGLDTGEDDAIILGLREGSHKIKPLRFQGMPGY